MSVRHAALWSMGSQYAGFAIQFTVTVIISRYFLTPSEIGLYSIAVAATMLLAMFQDFGLTRYISGLEAVDDERIAACMSVAILLGLAIAAAIFLSVWPIAHYYGDERLVPLLAILGASYLLTPFSLIPTALLTRDLDFRHLFVANVGSAGAAAIVAIGLAWQGFSASALAWSIVVQAVVRTAIVQTNRPVGIPLPLMLANVRSILRFGGGSATLTVIGAVGVRTPDLIIGRILTFADVGLFSRATSLAAQLFMLLSGAIGSIFYSAFARIRDRGEALAPPYTRVVSAYCAVTMPAMVGLSVGAVPLINALFGPAWAESATVLRWIALSQICFIALPLHIDLPVLMGRMKSLIWYNLTESIVSVVLLIAAARWGLEWAAISRIGYGLIWYAIYARFMQRLIGFEWRALTAIYLKSAIVSAVAVVPLLLSYRFWVGPEAMGFLHLALLSGIGAICWLAAMIAIRHPATVEIREMALTALPGLARFSGRAA